MWQAFDLESLALTLGVFSHTFRAKSRKLAFDNFNGFPQTLEFRSTSVDFNHFQSLSVTFCHFLSLSIAFSQFQLL